VGSAVMRRTDSRMSGCCLPRLSHHSHLGPAVRRRCCGVLWARFFLRPLRMRNDGPTVGSTFRCMEGEGSPLGLPKGFWEMAEAEVDAEWTRQIRCVMCSVTTKKLH